MIKQSSNTSIFLTPNKYNYRVNIHHPVIAPMYQRYKKSIGESHFRISDEQRKEFETKVINWWLKHHPQYMAIVSEALSKEQPVPDFDEQ